VGEGDLRKSKGICGVLRKITEFRVDMIDNEYKVLSKLRIRAMDWSYIYGYISFGLGLLFLLGLIGFTWMALRKIRSRPVL
jgi:hypothetical protein